MALNTADCSGECESVFVPTDEVVFNQNFRDLAERSFDIIFTVDAAGRLTYVSPAIETILGYTPREAVGMHFVQLLAESAIIKTSRMFTDALKSPRSQCVRVELRKKNGTLATIEVTAVPILEEGRMVGAQGAARDLSERIQMEKTLREQTVALRRSQEEIIHRLVSASLYRDGETGMHIRRTGLLSGFLAKAAAWSAGEAENLRFAAPMHDVGKIGIPDAILRKPDKLTPEEFEIMKTHSVIGAKLLAGSDTPMLKMAEEVALNHHERWDGAGYPAGLAGHAIPESARIVAIVDVFDALTHDRVYRPALSEEETLAIMRQGVGTHFDPMLLSLFFSHFEEICRLAAENPDERGGSESIGRLVLPAGAAPEMTQPAVQTR